MSRYVVIVDTSGSMHGCQNNLKPYVNAIIDGLIITGNEVALMSFSNDVHIRSHYTTIASDLNNMVNGLSFSGLTAFNDAIITGLVFENPRPDALLVFTDGGDNASDASKTDLTDLSNSLNINVHLVPPSDDTYTCSGFKLAPLFTTNVIPMKKAQANAHAIAERVKRAKVILEPEDILQLSNIAQQY